MEHITKRPSTCRKPNENFSPALDIGSHINAGGEPRPKAGAQRTLSGVGSTALFGPDPVGETQCVEKGKPYWLMCSHRAGYAIIAA
jgi:hypothetical protein